MIRLHFLNVGHGDCTLVEFPSGRLMMVDINNSKSLDKDSEKELLEFYGIESTAYRLNKLLGGTDLMSEKGYDIKLTDPIDYYKNHFGDKHLFRFVCTHPDMDHISGLHRLHKQENIEIINFWDNQHSFDKADNEFENQTKYDKNDWDTYKEIRSSSDSPKVIFVDRHFNNSYYNDDGIYILAATPELRKHAHENDDTNHMSYVLLIQHGQSRIILGGDATEHVWEDILNEFGSEFLKSTVLKASHHGRDSGYHQKAVEAINPLVTIISVGKKPDTDASNKYKNHSNNVWSTRWNGNIVLTCHEDGKVEYNKEFDR